MHPSLPDLLADAGSDPDSVYDAFTAWTKAQGIDLYPAQDEAIVEVYSGSNVVLATPTGTGKSLVAVAAHALALTSGERSVYTAPIKALVNEKFFALAEMFGADCVGMVTGDSSVNPDAPILCCTAEILANLALRMGNAAPVDQVVMDEFHFYGDSKRGWAWQVPLLTLPRAQFILMSATLGDTTMLRDDLTRRTGRPTALVAGAERPVPLRFTYEDRPVIDVVQSLIGDGESPIYIVHFAQAAALERALALANGGVTSREHRDRIAEAIGDVRFSTSFGKTLSRLIRAGIGVHHAGMLPRYRRLVETLAHAGLLKVICGTDTLGIGINVPLRTVILSALTKYDGQRMRRLTAREFHQIAGRAGRAGFDPHGNVVVMAPEHEIENAQALRKAGDDPAKRKKVQRKKPPEGQLAWSEQTFDKLVGADPEPLRPQMRMSSSVLLNVIARGGDAFDTVRALVFDNHEPRHAQRRLALRALALFRTLRAAGIVTAVDGAITLTIDLQPNFALNQPLSPFALAAIDLLDPDDSDGNVGTGSYALDVVSIIEATLDDPRAILASQQHRARAEAVAAMKRDGIGYDERMELIDDITHPQPLAELLDQSFETFAESQPWVQDFALRPKSVVRDMYEQAMTFAEFVSWYKLAASEGLVLRYLTDAWRAIRQTVPRQAFTDELEDIVAWLGEVIRQVDSSLVDEWAALASGRVPEPQTEVAPPAPPTLTANTRAFTVLVRNEMFRRVMLAARQADDELTQLDPDAEWPTALDHYYREHGSIGIDGAARSPSLVRIDHTEPRRWSVEQIIADPAGDHDWVIRASVDLDRSDAEGAAVVHVTDVGAR